MPTFEARTYRQIRRMHGALAVGLVALVVIIVTGWIQLRDTAEQVSVSRTENVRVWCHAINDLQRHLTAYVALFPHVRQLHLPSLDCGYLEAQTLASTQGK